MSIIDQVKNICDDYFSTDPDHIKIDLRAFDVTEGYSGQKILGFMQSVGELLVKENAGCYAEVGVFRGLTLASMAVSNPGLNCYGCDNFSQFNQEGDNKAMVENAVADLGLNNAKLLDGDFEVMIPEFGKWVDEKIGLYFFDGPHDYRSQLMGLMMVLPHLTEHAVIVIDDTNYGHVQLATADFLRAYPEFKVLMEVYTPTHPMIYREQPEELKKFTDTWWNGIHVLVRDPEDKIMSDMPFVHGSARPYLMNQHPGKGVTLDGAVNRIFAVRE